jgi:ATP-dependent Clp protease adaptor protein ClpS
MAIGLVCSLWTRTYSFFGLAVLFSGLVVANLPRWAARDLTEAGRRLESRDFPEARRLAQRFLKRVNRRPWIGSIVALSLDQAAPPVEVVSLNILTAAHIGLGDLTAARGTAEAALALAPNAADAAHMMGVLTQHTDKGSVARPWFEAADGLGYPYTADDQEALGRHGVFETFEDRTVERADVPPLESLLTLDGPFVVRLLNDDKTSMEFVVHALEDIFGMSHIAAVRSMLKIDRDGSADCGAYDRETAEAKAAEVTARAREAGFPLQCEVVARPSA